MPFPSTDQVAQAAAVLACGVVTAWVLSTSSPSPAELTQVDRGRLSAPAHGVLLKVSPSPVAPVIGSVPIPTPAVPTLPTMPAVNLPVTLPVTIPSPPPIPTPLPIRRVP